MGIVPGIMMCLLLALAAYVMAVRRGYPADGWKGFRHLLWSFVDALPGLLTAVIILGGVLLGHLHRHGIGRLRDDLGAVGDLAGLSGAAMGELRARRAHQRAHHGGGLPAGRHRDRLRLAAVHVSPAGIADRACWPSAAIPS